MTKLWALSRRRKRFPHSYHDKREHERRFEGAAPIYLCASENFELSSGERVAKRSSEVARQCEVADTRQGVGERERS